MEKKVNFGQYQQVTTQNLNDMQSFPERSVDDIVSDTLVSTRGYSGFVAVKSGPAEVTVGPGRLYFAGKVYAFDTSRVFDFGQQLPVAALRIAIVSGWGTEEDDDVGPVNFLVASLSTPQNPVYRPQVVAQTHARVAVLGSTLSVEAPQPDAPSVQSTLLPIVRIVLSPTGVDSVINLKNRVPNLKTVDLRLGAVETWKSRAEPELTSIESDIARLANEIKGLGRGSSAVMGRVLERLAVLEAKDGVPSDRADSVADFFLDPTTSALADLRSNCKIEEGVRFADDNAADSALQLFNPIDASATIAGGVLFPAYGLQKRFSIGPKKADVSLASYTYRTQDFFKKRMSRKRTRWGTLYTMCTNAVWWNSGSYDPVSQIFTLPNGEQFALDPDDAQKAAVDHVGVRVSQFWEDDFALTYWDIRPYTLTISGSACEQAFMAGQDMWLAAVDLTFTKLDKSGSVSVLLMQADRSGVGDPTKVVGAVTLDYSALQSSGATRFSFSTPVYVVAGTFYALRVISAANHSLATADGAAYANGMFFGYVDGYPLPDPTRHLVVDFQGCKFNQALSQIDLQGLQLSGGITSIDILAASIIPKSTTLTYQVKLPTGFWVNLDEATVGKLNADGSLPPLLPFRVVFGGSLNMQAAIDLTQSNVHLSRPKTNLTHIWPHDPRTPPAPTSQIRMTERYEAWNADYHTASRKLLTGANFMTETAPTSYSDARPSTGVLERTYVWNLAAPVASFKFRLDGATTVGLKTFHGANLKDWVF